MIARPVKFVIIAVLLSFAALQAPAQLPLGPVTEQPHLLPVPAAAHQATHPLLPKHKVRFKVAYLENWSLASFRFRCKTQLIAD